MEKLQDAFQNYVNLIQAKFGNLGDGPKPEKPFRLIANYSMNLQAMADILENSSEFNQLAKETRTAFSGKYHGNNDNGWGWAIRNFFRRSGCYIDVLDKTSVNYEHLFEIYQVAFQRQEFQNIYLAPVEYVYFSEEELDFGKFQLRRFVSQKLEEMFQNRGNKIFYPMASIDVKELQNYWFLCVKGLAPMSKLGMKGGILDLGDFMKVSTRYTKFPQAIETPLQELALFEWENPNGDEDIITNKLKDEKDHWVGFSGFNIPFVIILNDNLLASPNPAPDISKLDMIPYLDSITGEEIGMEPLVLFHFNKDEISRLKAFVLEIGNIVSGLRGSRKGLEFIDIALGYFLKAFFSEGLEQMLWHITTLEALLGESAEGVTERLARRIASILGETKDQKDIIRKNFKDLYDLRSDLVHGDSFEKPVLLGHLRYGRTLARQVLVWFLSYLHEILKRTEFDHYFQKFLPRKIILSLLDLDQSNREYLAALVKILPPEFPNVKNWITLLPSHTNTQ